MKVSEEQEATRESGIDTRKYGQQFIEPVLGAEQAQSKEAYQLSRRASICIVWRDLSSRL